MVESLLLLGFQVYLRSQNYHSTGEKQCKQIKCHDLWLFTFINSRAGMDEVLLLFPCDCVQHNRRVKDGRSIAGKATNCDQDPGILYMTLQRCLYVSVQNL